MGKKHLFMILLLLLPMSAVANQQGDVTAPSITIPEELTQYTLLYEKITHSPDRQSLAELFTLAQKAKEAFLRLDNSGNLAGHFSNVVFANGDTQETLQKKFAKYHDDMETFAKHISANIVGYRIYPRNDSFEFYLNSAAFLDMAKKHGLPEDVAFFEAYDTVFSQGEESPFYYEEISDVQGCANYSKLVLAYSIWQKLYQASTHPYYKKFAENQLPSIKMNRYEWNLKPSFMPYLGSGCSCESKDNTIAALKKMLLILPREKEKLEIQTNIHNMEKAIDAKNTGKAVEDSYDFNRECRL